MKAFKLKGILAVMVIAAIGIAISAFVGTNPMFGAIGLNMAFPGTLVKSVWIGDVSEKFYPNWNFMTAADDMSQWVENNTINLAEAGVDPNVLINNKTYPVPFAERDDIPHELPLDTYDTEGTVIRNAELIEIAYDKRASVLKGHKNALLNKFSQKAAHSWTPDTNSEFNPVIATTGTAGADGIKIITYKDIITLETKYLDLDAPLDNLHLVLNPTHLMHLQLEDIEKYKNIMQNGKIGSFKIWTYSKTPKFNKTTGAKVAWGAAAAPATDTIASFAFIGSEVMRCQGEFDMFYTLDDPQQKGDIMNFQMRALALKKRSKYCGAIYGGA